MLTEGSLLACCGSHKWTAGMMARQPFADAASALDAAAEAWWPLAPADWLEAFAAHPRIGERSADAQASREQSGVAGAQAATLARLAEANREYERRFGYIYIVCASGKSADEMLAILESRLRADPESELKTAAGEQLKITRLRLQKLLGGV
jgi:OHCU decarboxylase